MSTHQEFQAVWPDGTPVWEEMKSSPSFFQRFDNLCRGLKGLSVPKAYWPTVYVRTVTTTPSEWVTWGEHQRQEHQKNLASVQVPANGPVIPKAQDGPRDWGPITPRQIERVRAKRFSLSDPCVICGADFSDCPHTMVETELFIQYVKANYGHVLRRKQ